MKKKLVIFSLIIAILLTASCKTKINENNDPSATPTASSETDGPIDTQNPASGFWDEDIDAEGDVQALRYCLETLLSQIPGKYGFSYLNLTKGEYVEIRGSEKYIAGQATAIPVNLYLYMMVSNGSLVMNETIELTDQDRRGTDGDITDSTTGKVFTLGELSKASIEQGDYTALNMLVRYLGKQEINDYLESIRAANTDVPLYTSPADMAIFYKEIYDNTGISGSVFEELYNSLSASEDNRLLTRDFEDFIREYPRGIQGHEYGMNALNESGIFLEGNDYIICIFAEGTDIESGALKIAEVSKTVYGYSELGVLPETEREKLTMIPEYIVESARPYSNIYYEEVLQKSKLIANYFDKSLIGFPEAEDYAGDLGLLTFRGNNYRNGGAFGTADITEEKMEIVWEFDIGSISTQSGGYWPGVGWTGQPAIVHWEPEVRKSMNIKSKFMDKDLVEVIYASLDGNIYFCDLETGEWTRDPIHIGYPTKGTVSIDPRGYPLLYTGQGIGENGTDVLVPAYRIFSLIDQRLLYEIKGDDPDSLREWPNFDSSGLLDAANDTFYEAGENGIIYKMKLNTQYTKGSGSISVEPELTKYRYMNPFSSRIGIESSPVIYKNLMYFTDNGGMVACIDLNTMSAMWVAGTHEDTDSSPVLDITDEGVFLYTGNEVDINGEADNGAMGEYDSTISKFNALTGDLIWEVKYPCKYNSVINGGVLGTPVVGKNDMKNIVVFGLAKWGGEYKGKLVALDKMTGQEVWSIDSEAYSWSSPTAVYTPEGKGYILYCNFAGNMYLIEGTTGRIADTISLGANVEGSPGVYNSTAVIGSYARKIFGVIIE
ncbi:MAG: serine hydrolase [Clostridia bacterium]|nr:serine hydrolase [Clostridia bacterium]MBN2884082.1 serine hydrolase [Clostridia bacterium]